MAIHTDVTIKLSRTHHVFLGNVKIVSGKKFRHWDIESTIEQLHFARIPTNMRKLSENQFYNGLYDHFARGCSCEHDCCGHYFGGISEVRVIGRKLVIKTSYSRNL